MSPFTDQLERRNKMRQKRDREEKKLQKRAESFAREQYGCSSSPPRRLRLDSLHHFPECGSEEPSTSFSRLDLCSFFISCLVDIEFLFLAIFKLQE